MRVVEFLQTDKMAGFTKQKIKYRKFFSQLNKVLYIVFTGENYGFDIYVFPCHRQNVLNI